MSQLAEALRESLYSMLRDLWEAHDELPTGLQRDRLLEQINKLDEAIGALE